MSKVVLKLIKEKEIRGKTFTPGTVMGEVNVQKEFQPTDIDIGIKLGEVRIGEIIDKKS